MTKELFLNGELQLSRKETHGRKRKEKQMPVFNSRMEKLVYYKIDIRNVLDIKGFFRDIKANWNTYVLQVNQWIQKIPVRKIVVTGIFTVVLANFATTSNAAWVEEYTYQVKNGEKIETIAEKHGVTVQEILDANGLTSIEGKKVLLPKVQDRIVTASVLNIRSEPSTESSIVGKFKKGDVAKVVSIENGWAGILIKGRLCFVSADYLAMNQEIKSTSMYVTASTLRVRKAASTNSEVIGWLKSNDSVSVISTSNGWAKINFKGKTAYVSEAYLSKNEQTKPTMNSTNTYVVKSGDTFTKISNALGVSVSEIQNLNKGVNPLKLKIGQIIKVPSAAVTTTNEITITAQIAGVDSHGTFRFISSDGITYAAKATGNMINELFHHQGKKVTLTLEGNRGTLLNLVSIK